MYKIKPKLLSRAVPATDPTAIIAGEVADAEAFSEFSATAVSAVAFVPVSFSPIHQLPFSPMYGVRPSLPFSPTTLPRLAVVPSV